MSHIAHLTVEQGPDRGRTLIIPPAGARFGRAPKNDVVLTDPLLSRHHCRFFFKEQAGLHVADLASANQTLVNGAPIEEARLKVGDLVVIGDTHLRVLDAGATAGGTPQAPGADSAPPTGRRLPMFNRTLLIGIAGILVVLAAGIWIYRLTRTSNRPSTTTTVAAPAPLRPLAIAYERVEADTEGIFRYFLTISLDNRLSVNITDTDKTRLDESAPLEEQTLRELIDFIEGSGFFELLPEHRGLKPDALAQRDLIITLGRKAHRVTVVNRVDPPAFQAVRERLEKLSETALGIWAVQYSTEQRLEMAQNAYQRAKTAQAQREVQYANLSTAVDAYIEADRLLQSIEPKPTYYPDLLASRTDAEKQLEQSYIDLSWNADLAMKRSAWEEAARHLRIIREMIPKRDDLRWQEANRKLIEVEQRIERMK